MFIHFLIKITKHPCKNLILSWLNFFLVFYIFDTILIYSFFSIFVSVLNLLNSYFVSCFHFYSVFLLVFVLISLRLQIDFVTWTLILCLARIWVDFFFREWILRFRQSSIGRSPRPETPKTILSEFKF